MRFRLLTITLLFCPATAAGGPHWNQFRGSSGDGNAGAANLPVKWSEGTDTIRWKTAIHGKAWSSPVVWDGRIWLTTATEDGTKMSLLCVAADSGKILHDVVVFENDEPFFCHPTNSYASPTPFIEDGRIYVHFGRYGTACYDTESMKRLWQRRDFESDDFRGPASSPVIWNNLLIVHFDGVDVQFVVALNKATGRTVWKRDRDIDYGTDNPDRKKAYSTPKVIDFAGRTQVICPSAVETIAYDPETGQTLWRVRHGGMNAAAKPLFGHGLVYISAGSDRRSLIAVRPDGTGTLDDDHIVWTAAKGVPKRSSQLLIGDQYFMISDDGVASCLDAHSGEIVWQHRFRGEFWSSPIHSNGRIYFSSKDGRVFVIRASAEFELLAENEMESGINASPAVDGNALILRTFTHLYRIEN